jgi:hypothetical protein
LRPDLPQLRELYPLLAQLMQMSIPSKTTCPKLTHDGPPPEWMEAYKKKKISTIEGSGVEGSTQDQSEGRGLTIF